MNNIIKNINSSNLFDFSQTFEIYNHCAKTLIQEEETGSDILIHILNNKNKFDRKLDEMLADLAESIGFYPYIEKEKFNLSSTSASIRWNANLSKNISNKCFHDEQKKILKFIENKRNIIVSAPTSFGKSLLIEEIVASRKFKNIVVIQPTLALLDETRRKLTKYSDSYKLIVRTSQKTSTTKNNLFLLTSERVNEYPELPKIDFLIIDEFYKLSSKRDDERSDSLNNAFQYILNNFNPQFYLLGPNIDDISPGFQSRYNAEFYKTKYHLVAAEEVDIYQEYKNQFGDTGPKKKFKEKVLFELLYTLKDQSTIIYCSSPNKARYLSKEYCSFIESKVDKNNECDFNIISWIEKYVSHQWSLINCLQHGIGFHDGALQKHITTTIIELFNSKKIKTLFCTATIIEGVNTTAKNVIYFDKKKGRNTPIDYFDYANIKGRAGRLMEHYVGKIFNFNPSPPKSQIYIDIPFHEQNPISDEILINVKDEDISNKDSPQYAFISNMPPDEKQLFSKNALHIKGQCDLLSKLRSDLIQKHELLCWDTMPTYKQLEYCLGLAWDYLLKPDEDLRPMTISRLVKLTFDYGISKDISVLVDNNLKYKKSHNEKNKDHQTLLDESILESFQVLRYWFQYKIPKWLIVVSEIQKFVCSERGLRSGNYVFYASSIECDFIRENLTILSEFGIPRSALVKLEKYIPADLDQDLVLETVLKKRIYTHHDFLDYERDKFISNLYGRDIAV